MSTNSSESTIDLTALSNRLDAAESRYRRAERRTRILSGCLVATIASVVLIPIALPAVAQTTLTLEDRVAALEAKTASMTAITDPNTSEPTVRFTGVNVQVVSGSGTTSGTVNGTGNLIIGYNETGNGNGDYRTGSHNLIIGGANTYTSYAGIVAGYSNYLSERFSGILGGSSNVVYGGPFSSILGGQGNTTSGFGSCISGGFANTASGVDSSASGGWDNFATGDYSSISGGNLNTSSGQASAISGGQSHTMSTSYGWVGGSYHTP